MPELTGDDLATILFTSGSTGASKGAWSEHRSVVHGAMSYAAQTLMLRTYLTEKGEAPTGQPIALVAIPLFHITAEVPLFLQSLLIGRRLVLMPKWDVREAMRLIEQEGVTYFVGVPLMSYEIATHPELRQLRSDQLQVSIRCRRSSAAGRTCHPDPRSLAARLPAAWLWPDRNQCSGLRQFQRELPGQADQHRPRQPCRSSNWRSWAMMAQRCPQGQTGEIAFRTIANFGGYWNNPEATAAAFRPDGFFLTGDLGYTDEDGYLFIVDRKKEIIIRGGENISCIEVEQALYSHPDVAEASVFGLPDERFGEVPVAVVYAKPGHTLDLQATARVRRQTDCPFQDAGANLAGERTPAPPRHRESRQAHAQSPLCRIGKRRYIVHHDHQPHPQSTRHHRPPCAGRGDCPGGGGKRRTGRAVEEGCRAAARVRSTMAAKRLPAASPKSQLRAMNAPKRSPS